MKKPVSNDTVSFKPTERCLDCGCWLRSGNHSGRCALHTKAFENRPKSPPPEPKPEPEPAHDPKSEPEPAPPHV